MAFSTTVIVVWAIGVATSGSTLFAPFGEHSFWSSERRFNSELSKTFQNTVPLRDGPELKLKLSPTLGVIARFTFVDFLT
jgi:hypothetical protein